jgi:hypothetical protein
MYEFIFSCSIYLLGIFSPLDGNQLDNVPEGLFQELFNLKTL